MVYNSDRFYLLLYRTILFSDWVQDVYIGDSMTVLVFFFNYLAVGRIAASRVQDPWFTLELRSLSVPDFHMVSWCLCLLSLGYPVSPQFKWCSAMDWHPILGEFSCPVFLGQDPVPPLP